MSSNLGCVGLAVTTTDELAELLGRAAPAAQAIGTFDGVRVHRWQDPSGAALVLGWRGPELEDLVPTYASTVGGFVSDARLIHESIASAAIVDEQGEQLTAATFEAEEYRQLRTINGAVSGAARITALGVSVSVHPDEAAFAASPESLVSPGDTDRGEPPARYVENGWAWPPRMGPESFISYGAFGDPAQSSGHARLSGTVLDARTASCELTGQRFHVATVRTVGFDAALCLAASEHDRPEAGAIVSGTVVLVAALDAVPDPVGHPSPGPGSHR